MAAMALADDEPQMARDAPSMSALEPMSSTADVHESFDEPEQYTRKTIDEPPPEYVVPSYQ